MPPRFQLVRSISALAGAAALYGYAAGSAHSQLYALRNLIKFPLLIVVTTAVCSVTYSLVARFAATELSFREVQRGVIDLFRDLSIMLASCSPAVFFIGHSIRLPQGDQLGEYPLYLGFNVVLIACCGGLALLTSARRLLQHHPLSSRRAWTLIASWLVITLLVGAQWAWFLRPFYGVTTAAETPFCLAYDPDFRGDRSFYEAVYHLVAPPG